MSDVFWMRRSLALAARARGRTAPNPMVGAVVVRDGLLIGEGWHRAPGQAHGEVDALARCDESPRGATIYVNLEPCCHWGRTPPCTDALLAAGISRVVVGMVDPDPRVSGRGIEILRRAGVEVEVGVLEADARKLNAAYLCAVERRRPRVLLKAAITLDGRIADSQGASQWITGPAAREAGHKLRDASDAVLVGSGTLLADDPSLNTRLPNGRDALPVVLDGALRTPPHAKLLRAGRRPVLFAGPDAPDPGLPADIVRIPRGDDGDLDLARALNHLLGLGVQQVLVEGGARVHRSFLAAGLVDELHLFLAPKVLGAGPAWLAGPGWSLDGAPGFSLVSSTPVGPDLHLVYQAAATAPIAPEPPCSPVS